jgi:hypothetical protein
MIGPYVANAAYPLFSTFIHGRLKAAMAWPEPRPSSASFFPANRTITMRRMKHAPHTAGHLQSGHQQVRTRQQAEIAEGEQRPEPPITRKVQIERQRQREQDAPVGA